MIINDIFQEIIMITQELIGKGLTVQENMPDRDQNSIYWKDQKNISQLLRQMSYIDKYKLIVGEENFNFKMLDGALVQLQYAFADQGRELVAHRLAYYPSPILERYESAPEDYEKKYFGDSEFHDLFEKYSITFPIRFDYVSSTPPFVEIHHPFSHLHLGDFETCRIPVKGPISPSQFLNFVLRNFYNTAIVQYCDNLHFQTGCILNSTITENEIDLLHISFK